MKKRLILLLVFLLAITAIPCYAAEKQYDEDGYYYAQDSDFLWKKDTTHPGRYDTPHGEGRYQYIGTENKVILPDTIEGVPMTSYFCMFINWPGEELYVKSNNPNITRARSMVQGCTNLKVLDLSQCYMNLTDMDGFCDSSSNLVYADLAGVDSSGVNTSPKFNGTFYNATSLVYLYGKSSVDIEGYLSSAANPANIKPTLRPAVTSLTDSKAIKEFQVGDRFKDFTRLVRADGGSCDGLLSKTTFTLTKVR